MGSEHVGEEVECRKEVFDRHGLIGGQVDSSEMLRKSVDNLQRCYQRQ